MEDTPGTAAALGAPKVPGLARERSEPPPELWSRAGDPRLVNAQTSVNQGSTMMLIGKVESMDACGSSDGWFFDNNAAPRSIALCPKSCESITSTPNGSAQVVYGCPSIPGR